MNHEASCSCGQLKLTYTGEITKTSVCHCLECQKRTGSAFGFQTRVEESKVTIEGESSLYKRTGESGGTATFHFCPHCGSTVYWKADGLPGSVYVAAGAFANPNLPGPSYMVYGNRMHHWVKMPESAVEIFD